MIAYSRDHERWATTIRLDSDRLELTTVGKGVINPPRTLAVSVGDLKNFALVPTVQLQQVVGGRPANILTDHSYDSELFLSYTVGGKLKKKRTFVNSQDPQFREILSALKAKRPEASLLELPPAEVHKRMGLLTPAQTVRIILGLLIGVPILIAILFVVLSSRR